MPDPESDDSLRETAKDRGFKLVRSGKRKPGSTQVEAMSDIDSKNAHESFRS